MSRDKQIAEMARIAYEIEIFDESDAKIVVDEGLLDTLLNLYNAGYRKASEVAREILTAISSYCSSKLEEARDKANHAMIAYNNDEIRIWLNRQRAYEDIASKILELKQKYVEDNGAT